MRRALFGLMLLAAIIPQPARAQRPAQTATLWAVDLEIVEPAVPAAAPPAACAAPAGALTRRLHHGHEAIACLGHVKARLADWFCYRDVGRCNKKPYCATPCSIPLYVYFLRECAYGPAPCCGKGTMGADGAVNPPYQRSVVPGWGGLGAGCAYGGCAKGGH